METLAEEPHVWGSVGLSEELGRVEALVEVQKALPVRVLRNMSSSGEG